MGIGFSFHAIFLCWVLGLHPLTWVGLSNTQSMAVAVSAWLLWAALGALLWLIIGETFYVLHQLIFSKNQHNSLHKPNQTSKLLGFSLLCGLVWVLIQQGYPSVMNWYVPWADLSLSQTQTALFKPFFQHLPPGSVTALIVSINIIAALWSTETTHLTKQTQQEETKTYSSKKLRTKHLQAATITAFLLVGFNTLFTHYQAPQTTSPVTPFTFQVWQGNLPIKTIRNKKSKAKDTTAYLSTLKQLSPLPQSNATLFFPEEGIIFGPIDWNHPKHHPQFAPLKQHLNNIAPQGDFIFGLTTFNSFSQPIRYYNSLLHLTADSTHFYHKQHLVPFGETVPSGLPIFPEAMWVTLMKWMNIPYIPSLSSGGENTPFHLGNGHTVGPLICFEITQHHLAQRYKYKQVSALFNSANLGWFHHHPVLTQQYLNIAQQRAIETHLPVIMSSNSGPSAIIDADGSIRASLSANQSGILQHQMTTNEKSSKINTLPWPVK